MMNEVDGHKSFGRVIVSTRVNMQPPIMPIARELWCYNTMILRSQKIFEILHVELERLPGNGHFGVLNLGGRHYFSELCNDEIIAAASLFACIIVDNGWFPDEATLLIRSAQYRW